MKLVFSKSDLNKAVGKALGNRDHTTVIHGAEKIAQEVVKNDSMRNTIDIIIKKINPSWVINSCTPVFA